MNSNRVLIIVDAQNDFCEGGTLAVPGGAAAAAALADLARRGGYRAVVTTRDFHIDPGDHFAAAGMDPDFAGVWPAHCVAGTAGAEYHPAVADLFADGLIDAEFLKGRYSAAYSGFEGADPATGTSLVQWLGAAEVTELDIAGIATDYCVRATALDARRAGFKVRVLLDHSVGVAAASTADAVAELAASGAQLVREMLVAL